MARDVKECIAIYEKLKEHQYIFTLEDGAKVPIIFAAKRFHHLLGLQKLTDIPSLQKNQNDYKHSSEYIYKLLKKGRIDTDSIWHSVYYDLISDRITYFDLLDDLLTDCHFVVDFDVHKVAENSRFVSELTETKYILYKRLPDGTILHFTLGVDDATHAPYPETFFSRCNSDYISGQNLLEVVDLTIR